MVHYYKLNNLDEFECIADKCPDTCCSGWMIEIDDKSLKKYETVEGNYRNILNERIDKTEHVFKQKANGECMFLCENKLCDMYSELGQAALCDTCRLYPRHIEEFLNVREMTLSISCPEAARLLLSREDILKMIEVSGKAFDAENDDDLNSDKKYDLDAESDEGDIEEFEDFDLELYEILLNARHDLIEIMQNRSCSYFVRAEKLVNYARRLQDELDGFEPVDFGASALGSYWLSKKLFDCLKELEHLKDDRADKLLQAEKILYESGEEDWEQNGKEFEEYCIRHQINLEVMKEQLTVYYLYAYFCGAVYDDYVEAKAVGAVAHTILMAELWMAKWLENNKYITLNEMSQVVYEYARELENSNPNLIKMDEMLDEISF